MHQALDEALFKPVANNRLAVALGGSSGKLPELAPQQFTELGASQVAYHLEAVPKGI